MKKIICASAFLTSLFLISCGGSNSKTATSEKDAGTVTAASTAVNEADWELKDISAIDTSLHYPSFSVKLPKDAKVWKDTLMLDNIHVTFKNNYQLTISYASAFLNDKWTLADMIAERRKSDIGLSNPADENMKVLLEDANGYMYTTQLKDASDGGKLIGNGPTGHFAYFTSDKKTGYFEIRDGVPAVTFVNEEEPVVYSEANTKKIREIIAASAIVK
jgi:hypothetical protein